MIDIILVVFHNNYIHLNICTSCSISITYTTYIHPVLSVPFIPSVSVPLLPPVPFIILAPVPKLIQAHKPEPTPESKSDIYCLQNLKASDCTFNMFIFSPFSVFSD